MQPDEGKAFVRLHCYQNRLICAQRSGNRER